MPYYYETQERAMAPGIVKDWPAVIKHPTDPRGRLVRQEAEKHPAEIIEELEAARKAINKIAAFAGHPDAAEGCRLILSEIKKLEVIQPCERSSRSEVSLLKEKIGDYEFVMQKRYLLLTAAFSTVQRFLELRGTDLVPPGTLELIADIRKELDNNG